MVELPKHEFAKKLHLVHGRLLFKNNDSAAGLFTVIVIATILGGLLYKFYARMGEWEILLPSLGFASVLLYGLHLILNQENVEIDKGNKEIL